VGPALAGPAGYWKTTSSTYNVVDDPVGNSSPEIVNPSDMGWLAAKDAGTDQETWNHEPIGNELF
jgi:hypothetical protein